MPLSSEIGPGPLARYESLIKYSLSKVELEAIVKNTNYRMETRTVKSVDDLWMILDIARRAGLGKLPIYIIYKDYARRLEDIAVDFEAVVDDLKVRPAGDLADVPDGTKYFPLHIWDEDGN